MKKNSKFLKKENRQSSLFKDAIKILSISMVYFLAHQLAFFFPDSENIIMLVWPAGGVGLAAFLLNSKRLWPALTIAFYISGILADVFLGGRSFMIGLGYMTANMVESISCAWLILYVSKDFKKFTRIREILALITGTFIINAFSSCIGAITSVLVLGSGFMQAWQSWYISDGLGILLMGPFIVVWITDARSFIKSIDFKKFIEGIICGFIWSIITFLIFYPLRTQLIYEFHPYFLVAFLAWPAIRFGQRGVTVVLMLLFAIAIVSPDISYGPSPWGSQDAFEDLSNRLIELQFFLAFLAIIGYLMAAGFDNLMRAKKELKESETSLKEAQRLAKIGNWQWTLATDTVKWSEVIYQINKWDINLPPPKYKDMALLYTPESWRKLDNAVVETLKTGKPYELELETNLPNGSTKHQYVHGEAKYSADGKIVGLNGVIQDITERKQIEIILKQKNEEIESQNEEYKQLNEELMNAKEKTEENEEKFRLLHENAGLGIGYYSTEGLVISFNSLAAKHMFGKPEDFIGKTIFNIFPAHEANIYYDRIKKAIESENPTVYEDFVQLPNDEKFFLSTFSKIENSNKKILGIQIISQDITSIKKTELELNKAKEKAVENEIRIQSVFAVAPTGIGLVRERVLLEVNPKICEMTGYTKEELLGENSLILYPSQQEFDYVGKEKYQQIREKGTGIIETKWKKKDGSIIDVLLASTPFDLMDMKKGVTFTALDITERKRLEKELIKTKEHAEESDHLKTAFLQNMSHEIRTPMNSIIGFSKLLEKPELSPEKRKSYTTIIVNNANQLLSIVTNILTISSVETKQEKTNIQKVCINNIIIDLISVFKPQATSQNISLYAKQKLNDKQSEIYTDKTKVTQILTNLITNALKYTHEGSIEFGYELLETNGRSSLQLTPQIQFYVKDTGIGIPIDQQQKIFERFRQADLSITKKYGGTGLGLSISKAFVELLGGEIWIESEPEKGSTFFFSIPYKAIHNIEPMNILTKQINMPITILIAENEEFNYLLIEEMLIDLDYKLIHAKDGDEALKICKSNPTINLILMDIKMPVLDGYEAAKEIKKFRPELPIIAQTAYALQQEIKQYSGIFDEYITKPIIENELKEKMMRFI